MNGNGDQGVFHLVLALTGARVGVGKGHIVL